MRHGRPPRPPMRRRKRRTPCRRSRLRRMLDVRPCQNLSRRKSGDRGAPISSRDKRTNKPRNARRTHALHGAHGPQRRRGAACDHKARTHNKAHPEKQRDGSRSNLVDEQARKRIRDKRGNRARQKHETSLHGASPIQSFNIKRHKQRNAHERSKQAIESPEAIDKFPVRATCGFFSSHFVPTLYQILKPIPTFALLEA